MNIQQIHRLSELLKRGHKIIYRPTLDYVTTITTDRAFLVGGKYVDLLESPEEDFSIVLTPQEAYDGETATLEMKELINIANVNMSDHDWKSRAENHRFTKPEYIEAVKRSMIEMLDDPSELCDYPGCGQFSPCIRCGK